MPDGLRTEYLVDPLGIDVEQPRLSWTLSSSRNGEKQTAYQILVAGSPANLAKDTGDLWDSKKVDSGATAQIAYAGRPLTSRSEGLVEGPRLGCAGPSRAVEQTGNLVHGPPSRFRLGGGIHRRPGPGIPVAAQDIHSETEAAPSRPLSSMLWATTNST